MTKSILVPTDFSLVCENAMMHAAGIAKQIKANLILTHVINKDTRIYLKKNNQSKETVSDYLRDYQKRLMEQFGLRVDFRVLEGRITEQIPKLIKELGIDLLMFGTHGKKGMQIITGSHAMKLISVIDIPVLVVQKRGFDSGYKTIVFPVNKSTQYNTKLDWTIFIASSFGATVKLFIYNETRKKVRVKMETVLRNIRSAFSAHKINFTEDTAKFEANFPKQIMEFAISNSAQLINIKVDNDEFEPSFIVGSPEEKILFNTAQIPVFCAQQKP
ncbi:MAG: universal stress protein [Bacteroidales bacterium]|nr:universal stress protein [Bacteroidales bacterium]